MPEIERKFIIETLSEQPFESSVPIDQGYITQPRDSVEVRLRKKGRTCYMTFKTGSGMVREEKELEITPALFESLWPLTRGRRVEKVRHTIPLDRGLVAEVDIFGGALSGLVVGEVEFASEASAMAFEPPAWFSAEVTRDEGYKNKALAVNGRPGEEP